MTDWIQNTRQTFIGIDISKGKDYSVLTEFVIEESHTDIVDGKEVTVVDKVRIINVDVIQIN